jgi:hypothetical protein
VVFVFGIDFLDIFSLASALPSADMLSSGIITSKIFSSYYDSEKARVPPPNEPRDVPGVAILVSYKSRIMPSKIFSSYYDSEKARVPPPNEPRDVPGVAILVSYKSRYTTGGFRRFFAQPL